MINLVRTVATRFKLTVLLAIPNLCHSWPRYGVVGSLKGTAGSRWSGALIRMSESAAKVKLFFCLFSFHGCATLFLRIHYKRTERRIRLCWEAT